MKHSHSTLHPSCLMGLSLVLRQWPCSICTDGTLLQWGPWRPLPTCQGPGVNSVVLCLGPRSSVLQALLVFAMLSTCVAELFHFVSHGQGRDHTSHRLLKAPCMILFFSILFWGINPSSPLSASVKPPNVTINPGYFRTHSHVPRETAIVTLNLRQLWKAVVGPVCITVLRKVCLIQRLKMGKLCLFNRGAYQEKFLGIMSMSSSASWWMTGLIPTKCVSCLSPCVTV